MTLPMRIAICTNLSNSAGLQVEYELLSEYLKELEHEVFGVQYDAPKPDIPHCRLMISLETVTWHLFDLADEHWLFPNAEWFTPDMAAHVDSHYSRILTKTRESQRIFEKLFPKKTTYVGFRSRDRLVAKNFKQVRVLHIGGNSAEIRNTQAVIDAWKWRNKNFSPLPPLTVVSRQLEGQEAPPGVTILGYQSDEDLRVLQNSHLIHLQPSSTEGFGHTLRESLSAGAFLITTDAPPMNELMEGCAALVPSEGKRARNLAWMHEVNSIKIAECVHQLLVSGIMDIRLFEIARKVWVKQNHEFLKAFAVCLSELELGYTPHGAPAVVDNKAPRICFLGNFDASESTENMVSWALERIGCEVVQVQENAAKIHDLGDAVHDCQMFLWVRTPGWLQVDDREMYSFLRILNQMEKPTISLHLDKFIGIPDREPLIGVHPFWKTRYVFTADGSAPHVFEKRGVNHFWMRPAVSEVYCHPGWKRKEYLCDVGFVGAREYHREYPFRERLVRFLEEQYGGRFKHITGVRGHALNDFYASCKVVVGDCIFAGVPRYWSDRLPESCGRGAFLLHPEVEGLNVPVATYKAQDLIDLQDKIEMWLVDSNARREVTRACFNSVRRKDTWTIRMAEILKQVTGKWFR